MSKHGALRFARDILTRAFLLSSLTFMALVLLLMMHLQPTPTCDPAHPAKFCAVR